jgi:PhnB protein
MSVKAQPEGYHSVTPCLICQNAAGAADYYKQVFGAVEIVRMQGPDGRIMHAELKIGDSLIRLADESPEMHALSPPTVGGTPVTVLLYVPDVDTTFAEAVKWGAKAERAVATQFYGDRTAGVVDPWGHRWYLATHVEDVSPEQMRRRMQSPS